MSLDWDRFRSRHAGNDWTLAQLRNEWQRARLEASLVDGSVAGSAAAAKRRPVVRKKPVQRKATQKRGAASKRRVTQRKGKTAKAKHTKRVHKRAAHRAAPRRAAGNKCAVLIGKLRHEQTLAKDLTARLAAARNRAGSVLPFVEAERSVPGAGPAIRYDFD